ncbi:MAG: enamine deaminase RidA (YjgF/YER057c/UK114 family) [Gammaproteobacteria bacterium]|jgi:enamine deaminase RidA (YjgF/YER057c/UK114 family)
MQKRINIDSGRPLEGRAHYSRALRVNELVLQSGTTAIDRDGNVIGQDIRTQVRAVLDIARASMAAAGGAFSDITRARLYVVGTDNLLAASDEFSSALRDVSLALSVIPVSQLARPAQLVEIELEALDPEVGERTVLVSASERWRVPELRAGIRIGRRILPSAGSATGASVLEQAENCMASIRELIGSAGGAFNDLVCLRVYITEGAPEDDVLNQLKCCLGKVEPVLTLLTIPPLADSNAHMLMEAEAIVGAHRGSRLTPHLHYRGFSAALSVDDQIYLSNIEFLDATGAVQAPDDWASQRNGCTQELESILSRIDATLNDVIVRRYFTARDATMNSDYGDGPSWFATTRPAALGCRIVANLHRGSVLSLEAHAVRGASDNIEWKKL